MGQKIHPKGFRLPVTRDWSSRWFSNGRRFAAMLYEDLKVRQYLYKKLSGAAVSRILIERPAKSANITVYSARPGVAIGKKGEDLERLKADVEKMLSIPVHINIEEVRKPELDAQLVADSIAQQLERRVLFRRAMKRSIQSAMRFGAQGIKIASSGRLNGIEIARTEWYREGRVPLQTLKADVQYGFSEAKTTYGIIGVKVWIYKGDIASQRSGIARESASEAIRPAADPAAKKPRRDDPSGRRRSDGAKPQAKKASSGNKPRQGANKTAASVKSVGGEGDASAS